jgi:ubiquinone biosynthesis monooxygenase Coq7
MITDRIRHRVRQGSAHPFCASADHTRRYPAASSRSAPPEKERAHAEALMRINHVGEVCAQALYQGQALSCSDPAESGKRYNKPHMKKPNTWPGPSAASLNWVGRTSLLNPLWYLGALSIGFGAGKLGDDLEPRLSCRDRATGRGTPRPSPQRSPVQDLKSRAIVEQMRLDEISHAATAVRLGARELAGRRRLAMQLVSRTMTRTAYYV